MATMTDYGQCFLFELCQFDDIFTDLDQESFRLFCDFSSNDSIGKVEFDNGSDVDYGSVGGIWAFSFQAMGEGVGTQFHS